MGKKPLKKKKKKRSSREYRVQYELREEGEEEVVVSSRGRRQRGAEQEGPVRGGEVFYEQHLY